MPNNIERRITLLLFAWFWLTLCAYYVLRPVRSAMVLADFGPQVLPWLYMGTALATGAAVWVYTRFTHLPRRRLLGGVLAFFTLNLALWQWVLERGYPWASPAFYVWTDVFSIMGTGLFWMYANDVLSTGQAKRLFGLLAAAGPAGALAGAALTQHLVPRLGVSGMLGVAAGLYALNLAVLAGLEALTQGRSAPRSAELEPFERYDFSGLSGVIRAILSSRVLTLLSAVVFLERFLPDFVDYLFNTVAHQAYPDREGFAVFFARFEFWRNMLVLLGSLYATPKVLRFLGVHFALLSVPATIGIGCAAFALAPGLGAIVLLKGLEEGQRHSWFKAGKEVLYTATSLEVIYKVKGYIEMFLYRLSRGAAGLCLLILSALAGHDPVLVAAATLPLALAWGVVCWKLGRMYESLERREAGAPRAAPLAGSLSA